MTTLREHNELTWTALDNEYSSWRSHYMELQQFIMPRRGRFLETDVNKGTKRNASIIDNTATLAARTLRSGMMAGVTSPARPWFRLASPDPGMRNYGPVRHWLDTVDLILREVFARSNFYNSMQNLYGELGVFGTAPVAMMPDFNDVIRNYNFTVGSYRLAIDGRQVVNTMYRQIPMTVVQVVKMFGLENCSQSVKSLYEKSAYNEWVQVMHAIEPNDERDISKMDNRNMPYRSVYWEKGSKEDTFLRISGFKRFRVMAPRWDVMGSDVYGQCPGMDSLGDSKQLQVQHREKGRGQAKENNPPMVGDSSMQGKATNTLPGGISYSDKGPDGFKPAYQVSFDSNGLIADIRETQDRISRAFYEDLFLMLAQSDRREITAREVEERHEEKLLMLGPVMERLNDELLDPAIDLAFEECNEAGILPPPPKELEGVELGVEYISIMAQAQKLVGTVSIERFTGFVMNMAAGQAAAGAAPTALDKLDPDEAIDTYGDMLGVPVKIVNSADEVKQTRQAAAQKDQIAQTMAMAQQAAETGKTASEIDTGDGENLVSKILGSGVPGGANA